MAAWAGAGAPRARVASVPGAAEPARALLHTLPCSGQTHNQGVCKEGVLPWSEEHSEEPFLGLTSRQQAQS